MPTVQYVSTQQMQGQPMMCVAKPVVVQQQPAVQTIQTVQAQPVQVQQQPMMDGMDECMGCDCGMGCGPGMGFPVMSYFSISGLLILFGLIHVGVGIAAAVMIEECGGMMPPAEDPMMTPTMPPSMMPAMMNGGCAMIYTMISCLIGLGVLYTIAGCIGTCAASCMAGHVRSGLKTGFLVLSILSAVFVVGQLAILSTILANAEMISETMVALSAIGVVGGVIVFLLAVTGSSIACCCSPIADM